ncbi:MAG: vWA domain-containing protein, partial [Gemmatimonas sp.]
MSTRRLPVYILADVSGSMQGTPIESVKSGIRQLHRDLLGDPQAIESAYLSVLTFSNSAQQL